MAAPSAAQHLSTDAADVLEASAGAYPPVNHPQLVPLRLFVFKHGATYLPGELLTVTEGMTVEDIKREAMRLLSFPASTKPDQVAMFVVADQKYGRVNSLQQLCPNDSIILATRDDMPANDETIGASLGRPVAGALTGPLLTGRRRSARPERRRQCRR